MTQSTPNPLVTVGVASLESAINTALKLDSELSNKLAAMTGKTIALGCTNPNIVLTLVLGERCQLLQTVELDDPTVSASLSGTPAAWFELVRAEDKTAALINGDLKLNGDSRIFQELGKLASSVDIDWESWLADRIGDVPTHIAARAVEHTQSFTQTARSRIETLLSDFLHSDASPVVNKEQSNLLYRELRDLEMQMDRLEAKIKKLKDQARKL